MTLTSPTVVKKAIVVTRRSAAVGSSTTREKSYLEHVNAQFSNCQVSQSKAASSSRKGARIGNWIPTQNSQVITNPLMKHMPQFMQPYIDDIIDVVGDGYCGYRVVALHEGGNEEDYDLVKLNMTREIKLHRKLYEKVGFCERIEKKKKMKVSDAERIADTLSTIASAFELCEAVRKALIVHGSSIAEVVAELQRIEAIGSDLDWHSRCCQVT
jgi:hypothetical protein